MSVEVKTRLKKGDNIQVITGKEKGKRGQVLKVDTGSGVVYVERLNLVKRHTKPVQDKKGGIIEKEAPIKISNVMIYCNKCSKPVRIARKKLEDGSRVRICQKCNEQFE